MANDTIKTIEIQIQYNPLMPDEFVAEQARKAALQFLKRQKDLMKRTIPSIFLKLPKSPDEIGGKTVILYRPSIRHTEFHLMKWNGKEWVSELESVSIDTPSAFERFIEQKTK